MSSHDRRQVSSVLYGLVLAPTLLLVVLPPWWLVDLFLNFRNYVAALFGLIAVVALLRRQFRWAAAYFVAIPLLLYPLLVLWNETQPPVDTQAPTFTVWAHNVEYGRADAAAHLRRIDAKEPTVVIFLEATPDFVAKLTPENYVCESRAREDAFGILVCTRTHARVTWQQMITQTAQITIDVEGRTVSILAIHTWPPISPAAHKRRNQQIAAMAQWSRAQRGPHLVIGDFNAVPWSDVTLPLRELGLITSQVDHGFDATFSVMGLVPLPIDLAFHSRGLVTLSRDIGENFGSDHKLQIHRFGFAK